MPNPESREQQPDYIAKILNDIEHAPELIQAELDRTDNPWIACFISRATAVFGSVDLAKRNMQISNEAYAAAKKVIDSLNQQIPYWRNKAFKSKVRMLPDEAKDQLMSELNSIWGILNPESADEQKEA